MIKKGAHDVVKPEWIEDSISLGRPAPLSKRYFVFATDERQETDEYHMEDVRVAQPEPNKIDKPEDAESSSSQSKDDNIDPDLADWFKVDEPKLEDDSATEPDDDDGDSDNADVEGADVDDYVKATQAEDDNDDTEEDEDEEPVAKVSSVRPVLW